MCYPRKAIKNYCGIEMACYLSVNTDYLNVKMLSQSLRRCATTRPRTSDNKNSKIRFR